MRILYGVQGTGNGHISRATSLIPELRKIAQVDVLLSGNAPGRNLSSIQPDIVLKGYGFVFGKNGGIDWKATFSSFSFRQLFREIRQLDLSPYDLVINDFEPISAWAGKFQNKEVIGLSHQVSLLSKSVPGQDHMNWYKRLFLKYYAPYTKNYGSHVLVNGY